MSEALVKKDWERARERERERQTDRQTDRQTERQTWRERDAEIERKGHGEGGIERKRGEGSARQRRGQDGEDVEKRGGRNVRELNRRRRES